MTDDLQGKDFVALVRLSDGADHTLAAVGETCEKVPAGKHGGTVADTLRWLLESGLIAPVAMPLAAPAPDPVDLPAEVPAPIAETASVATEEGVE